MTAFLTVFCGHSWRMHVLVVLHKVYTYYVLLFSKDNQPLRVLERGWPSQN